MTNPIATTTPLAELSRQQLEAFAAQERAAYEALRQRSLSLDLTRGKPASAQLDLSNELLSLPRGHVDATGTDVRNYGGPAGAGRSCARSSRSCSGWTRRRWWPAATPASR